MSLQPPLGSIALSLSGGGYRAAGFHLGVLDLLNRLDLLKDVSALSTVSGGTFTGMRYALALKTGEAFPDFFERFSRDLRSVNVVNLALAKLTESPPSIPSGRWDVITACAQVYDENFFGGRRFEVFWEDPPIPLTDLAFNATEFRNAIAFRFQTRQNGLIGNGKVFITPAQGPPNPARGHRGGFILFSGRIRAAQFPGRFCLARHPGRQSHPERIAGERVDSLALNGWWRL